jgi:WD40 repeat protein
VTGLLADYTLLPNDPDLALVQATIRLSAHALAVDHDQLPAQLAGRTLGRHEPVLARLHAAAQGWSHTGWLEPLWPTLAQTGEGLRQTLPGHSGGVEAVAVSADGTTVVSGGRDDVLRVWDLTGATAPRELPGHSGGVSSVAVSADGTTAVSAGHDDVVRVWDLTGYRESVSWIADNAVRAVAATTTTVLVGDAAGRVHALQVRAPAAVLQ